jgi:hypothetical protein
VDHQKNTADLKVNAATEIVLVVLPGVSLEQTANVMRLADHQAITVFPAPVVMANVRRVLPDTWALIVNVIPVFQIQTTILKLILPFPIMILTMKHNQLKVGSVLQKF